MMVILCQSTSQMNQVMVLPTRNLHQNSQKTFKYAVHQSVESFKGISTCSILFTSMSIQKSDKGKLTSGNMKCHTMPYQWQPVSCHSENMENQVGHLYSTFKVCLAAVVCPERKRKVIDSCWGFLSAHFHSLQLPSEPQHPSLHLWPKPHLDRTS